MLRCRPRSSPPKLLWLVLYDTSLVTLQVKNFVGGYEPKQQYPRDITPLNFGHRRIKSSCVKSSVKPFHLYNETFKTCFTFDPRLHPIASRWARVLNQDVALSGYNVPSNVSILSLFLPILEFFIFFLSLSLSSLHAMRRLEFLGNNIPERNIFE